MSALRHTLISASAGSGKTYQLVHRYLHLLALGEKPSRITAVTFTRKAAGEFVNRILRKLSELAEDPKAARSFTAELGVPEDKAPNFAQVLKEVIRDLPRLRLGTIDSFFATVAACFPLELGQPVGASIMSEEESKRAKTEVITQLLSSLYREHDRNASSVLLEAFKQATFGNEEKRVLDTLNDWLGRGHDLWHECEDGSKWGQPDAIWPKPAHKNAAIWLQKDDIRKAFDTLVSVFDISTVKHKSAVKAWENIQQQVDELKLGQSPPSSLSTLLTKLAEIRDQLATGDATMKYYCDWQFTGAAAQAALDFLNTALGKELHTRCQRTQGIRQVIDAYESDYARSVRSRGRLSFADLARLLARTQSDGSWAEEESRADLWYRIDGQVDHWLFDEFQDTSAQQWSIMRGLVAEVLQDDEQRRSFFAVGDVKQSIYLWRKAEPQLFKHVLSQYKDTNGHGIVSATLAQSYRSSKDVLDLVNGVFEDNAKLTELLGARCLTHWSFKAHTAAQKIHGIGAFLQPAEAEEGEDKANEKTVVAAMLRQIQPTRRGLSCAVLVRSNKAAIEMTEYLRANTGLEVLSQSEEYPAEDNPATAAVLAALQLAAHPGDSLSLEHLRMTPLAPLFSEEADSWRALMNETLRVIHDEGFATAVDAWSERLTPASLDNFSQRRLSKLADIAAEFDENGSRDVDAFLEFARSYGARSGVAESAVQVMTVHKSKGLEFDVVLVPISDNSSLASADAEGLILKRDGLAPADWVLQFPTKAYVEIDPVLAAQKQAMDDEAGFESLCRLYVAMTRAKRALYVIAPRPPKKAGAINAAHVLRATLGDEPTPEVIEGIGVEWLRVHGDTQWFADIDIQAPASVSVEAPKHEPVSAIVRRHQSIAKRSTPSGEESFTVPGKILFSPGREIGRNLGTLLHQLMEQVDWLTSDQDEASIAQRWTQHRLDQQPAFDKAQSMALSVIRSPSCRSAFTPASPSTRLWRERPFDLVKPDGEWISGTVDRVLVDYDPNGRSTQATIIDYKTDDIPDDTALEAKLKGYQPQIALYRQAVAKLAGLPMSAVSASLLFTRSARLVAMG